jgi:FkbM family methyltransferase
MSYPYSTSCGEIGKILHVILNWVLPYKQDGVFVEVGANDGITGSFTYNLAKIGWTGLNFEPVPRLYAKCVDNHRAHPNVKTLPIAIGESSGTASIVDADTLSTMDADMRDAYHTIPQFSTNFVGAKTHTVKVEKLDTMLEENAINNIDILVIDVEGYEEYVLRGFSIERYNPSVIIIEIADQHPDFINNAVIMQKYNRLRSYFNIHNYSLLVNDIVDNVYITNELYERLHPDIIQYIQKMVNFPQKSL